MMSVDFFARTYCSQQFEHYGLKSGFVQSSAAFSAQKGTLRGLHFQAEPHWETKLVRCTRGAAFVVAVNLQADSVEHKQWLGCVLTATSGDSLYVPEGFAQGYQTLEDETELLYQMTEPYRPEFARGCAWDDPAFGIQWPLTPQSLSLKDSGWGAYLA